MGSAAAQSEALEQDENFYFIAGYTEGGFPYGVTWEEHEAEQSGSSNLKAGDVIQPASKLKLSDAQMSELVDTYDTQIDGLDFFLNIETGETVLLNQSDRDSDDLELNEIIEEGFNIVYFRIPHSTSHEGFSDMSEFVETVTDQQLKNKLYIALNQNKKIFRTFKDTLLQMLQELAQFSNYI